MDNLKQLDIINNSSKVFIIQKWLGVNFQIILSIITETIQGKNKPSNQPHV